MEALMREAEFPQEALEEVLEGMKKLKEKGQFSRLEEMADRIMTEMPHEKELRPLLQTVEGWEEEMEMPGYTLDLLVLLLCWKELRKRYVEKGMSLDIFRNSLFDMRYKLLECRQVKGVWGIFVGWWYDGFFDMTRFALGRLQFELRPYEGPDYEAQGLTVRKGDPVINMHIPSSGPLSAEEAEASFAQAAEYFRDTFPEGPVPFVMDSWLLDPDIMAVLPEGNIKAFVRRFSLQQFFKNPVFADGWRVFGSEADRKPEELPRRTRLQKAIADRLQQGGTFGEGYGIFVWPEKKV